MHEKHSKPQKPTVETFIRVTTRVEEDGITVYTDSKGVDVAWKLPGGGVVDLRTAPAFPAMFPCPYCGESEIAVSKGVATDRGHNPLKHVHPFLGA